MKPLPCPFCAYPATVKKDGDGWSAGCADIRNDCVAPRTVSFPSKADAIREWNTRRRVPQKPGPTLKQLKAELASLDKQIAAELAKRSAVKRPNSKTAKAVTRRTA